MKSIFTPILILCFTFACFLSYAQTKESVNFKTIGTFNSKVYTSISEAADEWENALKLDLTDQYINKETKKLKKLTYLQALQFGNNDITALPSEIGSLNGLMFVSSKGNKLKALPKEIENLSNLMYLEIHGSELDSLPKEIRSLYRLKSLQIQNNKSDTFKIPSEISYLNGLTDLLIYNVNQVNLPDSFGNLSKLERLTLVKCGITDIDSEISKLKTLKILNLDSNQVSNFPPILFKLSKLEYLSLKNNKLTSISEDISYLRNLQYLDLRGNEFEEYDIAILKALLPKCVILFDKKN